MEIVNKNIHESPSWYGLRVDCMMWSRTNVWVSEIMTGIITCSSQICHTTSLNIFHSFLSLLVRVTEIQNRDAHIFLQIELGNCKTWIVKLCDNTLILTFFVAKNLTNGMFYMFLTIIWLIYHCSSFQDQHLTFFAPNLGPNLIHSFNVCEQDITITAITDIRYSDLSSSFSTKIS